MGAKRNTPRVCEECKKSFLAVKSEVKRGGGKFCNRSCWNKYNKSNHAQDEKWYAWKGNKVGKEALHNWVQKHRGKPSKCEHCKSTKEKKYEWANKSQKYKRELDDWIRLCTKCHMAYDRPFRLKKYREWQKSVGFKVRPIKELDREYKDKSRRRLKE